MSKNKVVKKDSKKVGILSFHRTINYGSFLQNYCLQKALQDKIDARIETIDYNLVGMERRRKTDIINRNLSIIPKQLKKYFVFNRFLVNYLDLSKDKLITDSYKLATEFINRNNYDVVIVGSDEVWKVTEQRGFPNIYWLNKNINAIKMSYAASANKSSRLIDELSKDEKNFILETLESYTYIGVRDHYTYNQLKKLNTKWNLNFNPDPTFMHESKLDVRDKLVSRLKKKYNINFNKKIIGLMTSDKFVGKFISEKYGDEYEIISFHVKNKYAHTFVYDLNPFEFAEIFSILSLALTSFFHGSLFSIVNNIPFISIESNELYKKYQSKIEDLLLNFDLDENYFYLDDKFDYERFYSRVEAHLNYETNSNYETIIKYSQNEFNKFADNLRRILYETE